MDYHECIRSQEDIFSRVLLDDRIARSKSIPDRDDYFVYRVHHSGGGIGERSKVVSWEA